VILVILVMNLQTPDSSPEVSGIQSWGPSRDRPFATRINGGIGPRGRICSRLGVMVNWPEKLLGDNRGPMVRQGLGVAAERGTAGVVAPCAWLGRFSSEAQGG